MILSASTLTQNDPGTSDVLLVVALTTFVIGALFSIVRRRGWAIETALLFAGLAVLTLAVALR